jgi:hypothetical protein
MQSKKGSLADHHLFKRVKGFKEFETGTRAFIDVAALAQFGRKRGPEIAKIIDDLGVGNLKSLVFYSGFAGRAERSVAEFDTEGPRKGILGLVGGKPFTLADVPPLPNDTVSWSMTNFDFAGLYDLAVPIAEQVLKLASPDDVPKVKQILEQIDTALGVKLRLLQLAGRGPIHAGPDVSLQSERRREAPRRARPGNQGSGPDARRRRGD